MRKERKRQYAKIIAYCHKQLAEFYLLPRSKHDALLHVETGAAQLLFKACNKSEYNFRGLLINGKESTM